jgi:hypothetical protein
VAERRTLTVSRHSIGQIGTPAAVKALMYGSRLLTQKPVL